MGRVMGRAMGRMIGALVCGCCIATAQAQSLTLSVDAIEHPALAASGVRISLTGAADGHAQIEVDKLRIAGRDYAKLKLECEALRWTAASIECPRGTLRMPGEKQPWPLHFSYAMQTQTLDLTVEPERGEAWHLRTAGSSTSRSAIATLAQARLERLRAFLPILSEYNAAGKVSGTLRWQAGAKQAIVTDLHAVDVVFGDASGNHAGEKIAARLLLNAEANGEVWQWRGDLQMESGEVLWQPFYFAQAGHRVQLAGSATSKDIELTHGELALAGIGALRFSGAWGRAAETQPMAMKSLRFETDVIDLAQASTPLIAPVLEQAALPKFSLAGKLRAAGTLDAKGVSGLDVTLTEVSAEEATGGYALRGMQGSIPWRRDEATNANITVAGASLGRLPLGAFKLPLAMHGFSFSLPRVEIPVLDGKLVLEDLRAERVEKAAGGEWQWQVGGALQPVSMQRLTEALKLPHMAGALSASIPKIHQSHATVEMDGALVIQVFDGFIAATNLKALEPSGRVPRLYADLEMRHVDLGQLTDTFSFGSITGFIDGDVKGLELAAWRPQRFDAKIASSPGDYKKRISQRAVQNISSLGGAGAGAAIQRSFLGFFNDFGYDRLGWSCLLVAGVCEMGGVETTATGYVIVKGGGIPAINVMGYNHRVNWEELVTRLKRVTEGNSKPVIQ